MTDIIERLREWGSDWGHEPSLDLMKEAAAEIEKSRKWIEQLQYEVKNYAAENERLRDALAWLVTLKDITKQKDREMYEATKEVAWAEARAALQKDDGDACHAGRDGDCTWKHCPQVRDGEPEKSGRHCPLDVEEDENRYC